MPQASSGNGGPPGAAGDRESRATPGPRRERASRVLRRCFPSPRSTPQPNWWQLSRGYLSAGVIVALLAGGVSVARRPVPPPPPAAHCHGTSGSVIWYEGHECVGISDGSYPFGYPQVMGKILALNQQKSCAAADKHVTPVNVGVMVALHAVNVGVRGLHELEGIAAALSGARRAGSDLNVCWHPIHLLIAQMGKDEEAAAREARMLKNRSVVAVVGMGLSEQQSANAAAVLSGGQDPVPIVADLITAMGFTQGTPATDFGSAADPADSCPKPPAAADYERGFPGFFRTAYDAQTQVGELLNYLVHAPHPDAPLIIRPSNTPDPYSCTALPLITNGLNHDGLGAGRKVLFSPGEADPTALNAAASICLPRRPVEAVYAARAVYLSLLLADIAAQYRQGDCSAPSITVLSESDAAQLRVPATAAFENYRSQFLKSGAFTSGRLRLLYTPLADPDQIGQPQPAGFQDIKNAFTAENFPQPDLDDGWAIMGYDALATVVTALQQIDGRARPALVRDIINNANNAVPGADGPVRFDGNGNRIGMGPGLVRLCPDGGPPSDPMTKTVAVRGGMLPPCPQ